MSAYTKGPYSVNTAKLYEGVLIEAPAILTSGGALLTRVDFTQHTGKGFLADIGELNATTTLLAAAPDLLEALEAIQARIKGEYDNPALRKVGPLSSSVDEDIEWIASQAINKAKGEMK